MLDAAGNITLCVGTTKCIRPAVCAYSKTISTYLCCSSIHVLPVQPRITLPPISPRPRLPPPRSAGGHCPGGKVPLFFPNTQVSALLIHNNKDSAAAGVHGDDEVSRRIRVSLEEVLSGEQTPSTSSHLSSRFLLRRCLDILPYAFL